MGNRKLKKGNKNYGWKDGQSELYTDKIYYMYVVYTFMFFVA